MVSSDWQCCFCGDGIAALSDDPVQLTLSSRLAEDAEQSLWAHAWCLHRAVAPGIPLLPTLPQELALLPRELALQSASPTEIVLPYERALDALAAVEEQGGRFLGWEGWIRAPSGAVGHGQAPPGTGDFSGLGAAEAFRLGQETMQAAQAQWRSRDGKTELLFCLTVAAP